MNEYEVIKSKSPVFYGRYERKAELQQQTSASQRDGVGVTAGKSARRKITGTGPPGNRRGDKLDAERNYLGSNGVNFVSV